MVIKPLPCFSFLDASSHLYKRVFPSVRRSVGPSVGNQFFFIGDFTRNQYITHPEASWDHQYCPPPHHHHHHHLLFLFFIFLFSYWNLFLKDFKLKAGQRLQRTMSCRMQRIFFLSFHRSVHLSFLLSYLLA